MLWKDSDMDGSEAALRKDKPVPANPPSSGVSDAPGCNCNVEIWNLTRRRIEASLEVRFLRCSLHEAAPDLYTALDDLTDMTVSIDGPFVDPQFFSELRHRTRLALAALAKARGEKP
jgi:hypothetical protein